MWTGNIPSMLTIEIRDAQRALDGAAEVEIFCDRDGLSLLIRQLELLKSGPAHVHLMTPSWAGYELSETTVGKGTTLVNHLRITLL
jgi:immunity protein 32 of polymorphic toxin system